MSTTKTALRDWDAHVKAILQATDVDDNEHALDREKRVKRLEDNPAEWASYYFPHYKSAEFAHFHKQFFKDVISRDRVYVVREWARSHAKSVSAMMIGLYCVLTGRNKNVVLASYNESNASELLTPFRLELESNQRIINDYGKQKSLGDWEAGRFITKGGASFRAIGSGQSPRGTRNQEARPDLIICDDLDEDEMCRNPKRLDEAWEWMTGALYGCFDIIGTARFIVVGNRIAKDSLVARAAEKADLHSRINILDDKGQPSWKERYTLEDCQYMIDKMGYRLSQREYFNNPLTEGKTFKREWMQFRKLPALSRYKYLVAYLDPGFKKTKTSDTKSWILIGLFEGKFHVRKVFCGKASIEEMVAWGYEIDKLCKTKSATCLMKMEEVFLQDLLYKDFEAAGKTNGFVLPVSGDKRKKPDKDSRIAAMSGHFERGNVVFDEDIEKDHHAIALIDQLLVFEPGVNSRKDGPDALEGGLFILQSMIVNDAPISAGPSARSNDRL